MRVLFTAITIGNRRAPPLPDLLQLALEPPLGFGAVVANRQDPGLVGTVAAARDSSAHAAVVDVDLAGAVYALFGGLGGCLLAVYYGRRGSGVVAPDGVAGIRVRLADGRHVSVATRC